MSGRPRQRAAPTAWPARGAWQAALALGLVGLIGLAGSALPDEPSWSEEGADTCLKCHDDDATMAIFSSAHAFRSNPRTPFAHGQLQCEACHGPGGAHAGRVRRGQDRPPVIDFGAAASTPVAAQNGACLGCHAPDNARQWHDGLHELEGLACADCHRSHARADPALSPSAATNVCATCHRPQRIASRKAYAHRLDDGKLGCTSCHDAHAGNALGDAASSNELCYDCHADMRGPVLWEHAPVPEDCSNCHDPHGSPHAGMLVRRGPLLCQSCHTQAGHPAVARDGSGLANATPSKFLLGSNCVNCHSQVHGSNHPSGSKLMR